jgi:hypothetical protein
MVLEILTAGSEHLMCDAWASLSTDISDCSQGANGISSVLPRRSTEESSAAAKPDKDSCSIRTVDAGRKETLECPAKP